MGKSVLGFYRRPPPPQPDTTPPTAPSSLVATVTSNVVTLAFTASTDNVRVALYLITRQTDNTGLFVQIDTSPINAYTDHAVLTGHTYKYIVYAQDPSFNTSAASNTSNQVAVSLADVTPPFTPAVPTLLSQNTVSVPPTVTVSWPAVTDQDPGTGAPISGENNYLAKINGAVNPVPIPNSTTIGSDSPFVVGTNNGGSLVTGSDTGTTLSSTSTTGDLNAQHYGPGPESYFTNGAPVQGANWRAIHITGQTPFGSFSKVGVELRQDRTNNAAGVWVLSFGVTNGLKMEFRISAGAQAQGTATVAHPGFPFWLRIQETLAGLVTCDFSTNSTNPDPAANNGAWTVIGTQQMTFGIQRFSQKFADANTFGGTGGTVGCTYDQSLAGGVSPIVYTYNAVAGITNTIAVSAIDFAGNPSVYGPALSTAVAAPVAPSGRPNPSYGTYNIGDGATTYRYDNATWIAYAKLMRMNIMAWLPSGDQFASMTFTTVCTSINGSSINSKCFGYFDPFFLYPSSDAKLISTSQSNKFLLYQSGALIASGQPGGPSGGGFAAGVNYVAPNGAGTYVFNMTPGGPTDSAGRTGVQYAGAYGADYYVNGGAAGLAGGSHVPNSAMAGVFCDDMQGQVPGGSAGDWTRANGTQDYAYPNGVNTLALQQGFIQMMNALKAASNTPLLIGGNGGGTPSNNSLTPSPPTAYAGHWDLLIFENCLGGGNGCAGNPGIGGSAANMLKGYQLRAAALKTSGPVYGLFGASNIRSDGSQMLTWTNSSTFTYSPAWQGVRHSWAACLVGGDFDFFPCSTDPSNNGGNGAPYNSKAGSLFWVDWFQINIATGVAYSQANANNGSNWLGAAIDGPQTVSWSNGIFRRRFTNADVYWNPYGNGAKTGIALGGSFKKPTSAQDPFYNGATITTWSPADGDGLIALH